MEGALAELEQGALTSLDLSALGVRRSRDRDGVLNVQRLAAALEHNRTLTALNLNCNGMGPQGAELLAAALERNQTLADLNLSLNSIRSEFKKFGLGCWGDHKMPTSAAREQQFPTPDTDSSRRAIHVPL